jgi:hypothetical protein
MFRFFTAIQIKINHLIFFLKISASKNNRRGNTFVQEENIVTCYTVYDQNGPSKEE